MKTRQKRIVVFVSVFIIALALALGHLFLQVPLPEGSVLTRDIVSYCIGDAEGSGILSFFAIAGDGKIETGERHGKFLLVCDASAQSDMDELGFIQPEKIRHRIDLTAIKPMKIQLGDVNGDGVNELAICVYKTAKFHPVMAKRPFFFDLIEGNLIPVWLGSRLSRPFDDYIIYDIDNDSIDEIISIERLENGGVVLAVYNWRGFGFEMLTQSKEFDGDLYFEPDLAGQTAEAKEIGVVFFNKKEYIKLMFSLEDDMLVYH